MDASAKRIVLVGHCGPDSYSLRSAVSRMVPGAAVVFANDERALAGELPTADLLLVNRLLDGEYSAATGVDLIRAVGAAGGSKRPAMMLVSNLPEAQAEAQAAGAAPGFGKRDAYSEEAGQRVRAALGL
jgi:hypothetical protein